MFDSGLGGLTVVRELSDALPGEDIIYLGDTARSPYGIRPLETVRRFAREDAAFLLKFNPKMIVVACNTASAAAIDTLREHCPVEVVDVIGPGAAAAIACTGRGIGVIATQATIRSGAYQQAIAELDPPREVLTAACPLLVPIVEEGRDPDDPIVIHVLTDYLHEMQRRRPGALILGCTHYPLLRTAIAKLMGPDVALVSSASAAAAMARRRLDETSLRSTRTSGGALRCFTTESPDLFTTLAQRFFDGGGRKIDRVELAQMEAEMS